MLYSRNVKHQTSITQKKIKIKVKFCFITNFRPSKHSSYKLRQHKCRSFFLFIHFLIYYFTAISKQKKLIPQNLIYYIIPQLYFFKINKFNQNFKKINIKLVAELLQILPIKLVKTNVLKKNYTFFKNKYFFQKFKKLNIFNKNLTNIKFTFIIFTKIYSHFVILRAPFRDKISKNLLQHQRFFIYLNVFFLNQPHLFFCNKLNLYKFLKIFYTFSIFNSNLIFLKSQKISFCFLSNFLFSYLK